jgi:CHAD domain-containing protein
MITSETGRSHADPDAGSDDHVCQKSELGKTVRNEARFLIQEPEQTKSLIRSLELRGFQIDQQPTFDVVDRYFDTPDWQVLESGREFRWRETSNGFEMGLKSTGSDENPEQRQLEVEQPVEELPSSVRRIPKGPVAEALHDIETVNLKELIRVETRRRPFNLRTPDGALIELVLDRVSVVAVKKSKKRVAASLEFDELGLRWKEGSKLPLPELIAEIQTQFGLLPSRLTTFQRGLRFAGLVPPPRTRPETHHLEQVSCLRQLREGRLRKRDPITKLLYRYLLEQFEQVLFHEPHAWEGLDPEGVHRMRVAIRRSRAAHRAFKVFLPQEEIRSLGQELKWIAAVLGDVRDLDVYLDQFPRVKSQLPAQDAGNLAIYEQHLIDQRRIARKQLIECLTDRRYAQLKDSFLRLLRNGACQSACKSEPPQSIRRAAKRSIGKQYKKLLRDGRAIHDQSPDGELHALRIDCKRMRYLLEFFQPTYGKALSPCIQQFTRLQDLLGEFQDSCVASTRLREYAGEVSMPSQHRGELIALGQLIGIQEFRRRDRRTAFHNVWKQFDRPGQRKNILAVLS